MRKPKLGTGKRFASLTKGLARQGTSNPKALAAWIGRKKYGASRFQKLATTGKRDRGFYGHMTPPDGCEAMQTTGGNA